MTTRTRPSERLFTRLRDEGHPIPADTTLVRTRAGWHQRAAGAWSWVGLGPDGREIIGSQYPVNQLLRTERLVVSATTLGPWLTVDPG